jgi:hypothetical protein
MSSILGTITSYGGVCVLTHQYHLGTTNTPKSAFLRLRRVAATKLFVIPEADAGAMV